MDGEVFVLSDMTIEVNHFPGGPVIGFNGTTEWALDSVDQHDALWLPGEHQLRERSARRSSGWPGREAATASPSPRQGTITSYDGANPSEAYGRALLSRLKATAHPLACRTLVARSGQVRLDTSPLSSVSASPSTIWLDAGRTPRRPRTRGRSSSSWRAWMPDTLRSGSSGRNNTTTAATSRTQRAAEETSEMDPAKPSRNGRASRGVEVVAGTTCRRALRPAARRRS